MSEKPQKKLCDRCGQKPFDHFEQNVGYYELICSKVSNKMWAERYYQPDALESLKPGIYEAEFSE